MYLSKIDIQSFRDGVYQGFRKEAGIASAIGSGLEWLAPQTTNNFLRPAWHGVKKEFDNPNWSMDSVLNAAGKGVEANRFANIENKVSPYGVTFNKDQYGALDSNNPLDLMGSIKNMGSNALGWAKNNPGTLLGGAAAAGGIGYLLHNLFSSSNKRAPVQHQQMQQPYTPQEYNPQHYQQVDDGLGTLPKYKFGSSNPLDIRKYMSLQGAVPLTYNFAKKLPTWVNSPHQEEPQIPQEPQSHDINVSSQDKQIKRLLQKPEMRDYIIKLMQPRIV